MNLAKSNNVFKIGVQLHFQIFVLVIGWLWKKYRINISAGGYCSFRFKGCFFLKKVWESTPQTPRSVQKEVIFQGTEAKPNQTLKTKQVKKKNTHSQHTRAHPTPPNPALKKYVRNGNASFYSSRCFCSQQMEDFLKWNLSFLPVISKVAFTYEILLHRGFLLQSWSLYKCKRVSQKIFCHLVGYIHSLSIQIFCQATKWFTLSASCLWSCERWFLLGFGLLLWCSCYSPGLC